MGATVAIAVVSSLIAPRTNSRREASYFRVEVNATQRTEAGGVVSVHVRGRNVHPRRARVYPTHVDVSESLGLAGTVTLASSRENARWIPVARTWRLPFPDEIPPGESRDVALRIVDAKPGRYAGAVDVLLDGTSWVRSEVSFEVAEPLSARP